MIESRRFILKVVIVVALQLLVMTELADASPARQVYDWSDPVALTTEAKSPMVVADSAGDLHLFFVGSAEDNGERAAQTIYYMSRLGGQWQPPLDILFSPASSVQLSGVAVDKKGNLHLAWHDDEGAFHSRAHVSVAGNARNWETELVLSARYPTGEMVLDKNGRLHMVLVAGFVEVVYLYSDNGGERWSTTLPVYREFETDELAIAGAQLAVDITGVLHVTWYETALEVDWNLWSVWYGRSSDEGNSWQVTEMAAPQFGASDIAVDGDKNVHLVYGRIIGLGDGRWYQWSSDGGETWSNPRQLYPGVPHASGLTGGFDFVLDSAGRLHMVNSYGGQDGEASAWHMVWLGTRWSDPELVLGPEFHAHYSRLAIAGGNQLAFVGQAPRQASSLLYRQGRTDSPATETQPVPTRVVEMTAEESMSAASELAAPTPVASRIALSEEARQAPPVEAPFDALLISVGAAALIILLLLLVLRRSPERRR